MLSLELVKTRLAVMSMEMRKNFIQAILTSLIEKSPDAKILLPSALLPFSPPPPAPPISSVPLPALPSPSLLYPSILHPLRSLPRMSRPVSCHVRESLTRLWAPAPPQGPSLPLAPRAAT